MTNAILNSDSYKTSHYLQYPPGTKYVNSYIEARPIEGIDEVVFFGLQMFIKEYMTKPVTMSDIDEAEAFCAAHGVPFNREGWEIIVKDYGGYLPVEITALPEGMVVTPGTPMVQVVNNDERLPWLTSYIETALLRAVWYPSTVATVSRDVKKIIRGALLKSSDDPGGQIGFKLHDFGARGCTSMEQSGIGGAAHLVNFMGTDTMMGAIYAMRYYGAAMPGFSIPAAEHSTMTSWGQQRELDAFGNMLDKFPSGLVAVVSDSYDIYSAVEYVWGHDLREKVLARDGVTVIRPDSGDPADMVMWCLRSLEGNFGVTVNSKGYKVLNDKVRIIQGDGVDKESIGRIVARMMATGYSMDNVAFGMGAGLLQHVNRDTLRFAMKASAICGEDGKWYGVNKMPKSDPSKGSKRGVQHVCLERDGSIKVIGSDSGPIAYENDLLRPVYNMRLVMSEPMIRETDFDSVRALAEVK